MITVWGRRNSSNVAPVMWALDELDLEYRRHNVGGGFGGTQTEEYLAMNPNGLVPVIKDEDLVLWESNSIIRYLAERYDNGVLRPASAQERALADQWMEWCKTTFYPVFVPMFWQMIRTRPEEIDQRAIQDSVDTTAKVIMRLEKRLADYKYVAGDNFSVGDLPFAPVLHRYFNLPVERPDIPNTKAYFRRLSERPACRKHCLIPFGRNNDEWRLLERDFAQDCMTN